MFKLLNVILLLLLLHGSFLLAHKYEMEFQNSDIFSPCDDYPDNFLDKFLINGANFTQLPDGNFHVHGDVVLTYDFNPVVPYPLQAEVFRRERGEWRPTIFTVRRQNLCTDFFNPNEVWYKIVKDIPEEQRTCPFEKGQTFSLDLVTDTVFDVDMPILEGDYLGRVTVGTNAPPDNAFFCTEVYYKVYRV